MMKSRMMTENKDTVRNEKTREYEKPRLTRLGHLADVTRKSGPSSDMSMMNPNRP